MSSFDCMDICRLCLIKEQVSVPIFGGEGDTRQIFLKISTCLPVKISRDDTLPKTICNNCVYRVESSYQFWNTTLNSEKQLLEWLNTSNVEQQQQQEQHIADKEFAADINNVAALLETENTTLETEQLMLKEEYLPDTSTTDLRYLHSRESNVVGIEERQEGVEEDDTDSCDDPAGEDDESDSEESGAETANQKTEIDDDVVEGENTTPLEPTTFVNVSLACDEPGPSGLQQQSGSITDGASTSAAVIPPGGYEGRIGRQSVDKTQLYRNSEKTVNKYQCEICSKVFSSNAKLTSHTVVHSHERPFKCDICDKMFKRHGELRDHLKMHMQEKIYLCFCGSSFVQKSNYIHHKKRHLNQYKLMCQVCGKGFYTNAELTDHANTHKGEKPFHCDVCGGSYCSKRSLTVHKRKHDPMYKPKVVKHQCEICGKVFLHRGSLTVHMRSHTGNGFVCNFCGKSMKSKTILIVHERVHKGEKPFVCGNCGKSFASSEYLKVHLLTHSGEKPFCCNYCGKRFTQRSSLTSHKRYHTGEKPYSCEQCEEKFISKKHLKLHKKVHESQHIELNYDYIDSYEREVFTTVENTAHHFGF